MPVGLIAMRAIPLMTKQITKKSAVMATVIRTCIWGQAMIIRHSLSIVAAIARPWSKFSVQTHSHQTLLLLTAAVPMKLKRNTRINRKVIFRRFPSPPTIIQLNIMSPITVRIQVKLTSRYPYQQLMTRPCCR